MKLNKKQRLQIYKLALSSYIYPTENRYLFMCNVIRCWYNKLYRKRHSVEWVRQTFIELFKHEPEYSKSRQFQVWAPSEKSVKWTEEQQIAYRKKILIKVIKEMQNEAK